MRLFGVEITIDFSAPLARGEEVVRADGVMGQVTHFDGDEGYSNSIDDDVWVTWQDGQECWECPDQIQRRQGKR